MDDFVDLTTDPRIHTLSYYNKEIPYRLKDFKVDIDYHQKQREKESQENQPISDKEMRALEKMNKRIRIMRSEINLIISFLFLNFCY